MDQHAFQAAMINTTGTETGAQTSGRRKPTRRPQHGVAPSPHPSSPRYARNTTRQAAKQEPLPLPGAEHDTAHERFLATAISFNPEESAPVYKHPHGAIWLGDAAVWLRTLEAESVDLIFADPPYNIKKAEWDTFESQQAYVEWSLSWIKEAARALKPTGTLYI